MCSTSSGFDKYLTITWNHKPKTFPSGDENSDSRRTLDIWSKQITWLKSRVDTLLYLFIEYSALCYLSIILIDTLFNWRFSGAGHVNCWHKRLIGEKDYNTFQSQLMREGLSDVMIVELLQTFSNIKNYYIRFLSFLFDNKSEQLNGGTSKQYCLLFYNNFSILRCNIQIYTKDMP